MYSESMTSILIVEDNIVSAMELEELLLAEGYEICGLAYVGSEAISKAEKLAPDVILMDIGLPGGMDGIEAAERINSNLNIPILFLTGHSEQEFVERAGRVNPKGFILKPYNASQIRVAIEIAIANHKREKDSRPFVPDKYTLSESAFFKSISDKIPDITNAEMKIAYLVCQGQRTKEISNSLGLSKHTVSWHRNNIRKKMELSREDRNLMTALQAFLV